MAKENQNRIIYKGNAIVLPFFVENVANLVGYKAYWKLMQGGTTKLLKSTEHTPATITISGTIVYVTLASTDTDYSSSITAGEYDHELLLIDGDDKPHTATGSSTITVKDTLIRSADL